VVECELRIEVERGVWCECTDLLGASCWLPMWVLEPLVLGVTKVAYVGRLDIKAGSGGLEMVGLGLGETRHVSRLFSWGLACIVWYLPT
jgi:hypothetical protein